MYINGIFSKNIYFLKRPSVLHSINLEKNRLKLLTKHSSKGVSMFCGEENQRNFNAVLVSWIIKSNIKTASDRKPPLLQDRTENKSIQVECVRGQRVLRTNATAFEQQLDSVETHMPRAALLIPPPILNAPRQQPKVARCDPNHKEVTTNGGPLSWSHRLKDKCSRCGEKARTSTPLLDVFPQPQGKPDRSWKETDSHLQPGGQRSSGGN